MKYWIDEEEERVRIMHDDGEFAGYSLDFDDLANDAEFSKMFLHDREDLYLIARDELIERGLIEDRS